MACSPPSAAAPPIRQAPPSPLLGRIPLNRLTAKLSLSPREAETPATSWRPAAILTLLAAADEDSKVQRETSMRRSQAKAIIEERKRVEKERAREIAPAGPVAPPLRSAELVGPQSTKQSATGMVPETEQRFTLAEAFYFNQNSGKNTFDLEKAIRSVSYLLAWHAQIGNAPVPGFVAQGLSETLDHCAEELRHLFTWDDIFALGGNPGDVLRAKEAAGHALPIDRASER